jgi:hypothetical protein
MTYLEIGLFIAQGVHFGVIYSLVKKNRDLKFCLTTSQELVVDWKCSFEKEKEQNQKHLNKIMELEKKIKLSSDVVAVLNDIQQGGALLHVERVDRNDVFFHQGGQYR